MPARRTVGSDRGGDLLASAARLFREKGVRAVSVDDIVQGAGVAKGTFYLYFKIKDDLLAKLAEVVVQQMAQAATDASHAEGGPIERFVAAVLAMQSVDRSQQYLVDALNHPENTALHDLTNVALVRQVAPILAAIVEQGRDDGTFDVEDAQATIEFLLAGQAALLGGGHFNWSSGEHARRLRATIIIIERSLGVAAGRLAEQFAAAGLGGVGAA